MRSGALGCLCGLLLACRPAAPPEQDAAEARPPFDAASAVTRADTGSVVTGHRIIALMPMTGDVEILHGDPETAGKPFVMRIRELPGTRVPPHSHPVDEHITVVQGSWYFAVGERWDSASLREMKPGAYAFAPAGTTMFAYSPEGAVVQVHGVGPFHIRWQDGSATLDDAGGPASFGFRKGDRVDTSRGRGTIRQGYASGAIVQYEIETEEGALFMADEADLRRI